MYTFLSRKDPLDDKLRTLGPDPALYHNGSYKKLLHDHLAHNTQLAIGEKDVRPIGPLLLRRIADSRTMRMAFDHLRTYGGDSPGLDGIQASDLENEAVWNMCRRLADAVKSRSYRPGPVRLVKIHKEYKSGYRTLSIQNLEDRIVSKAAALILGPVVDQKFSAYSFGFWSERSPQQAVATAIALQKRKILGTWVTADIAAAFDVVPHARLLDACRRHFPQDVVDFIHVLVDSPAKRGLPQGAPLSPLLFNIFADHFLDQPFAQKYPRVPLMRYADDLLLLGANTAEARDALAYLQKLARSIGTPLKEGVSGPVLREVSSGESIEWLGFLLQGQSGQIVIRTTPTAWNHLASNLDDTHLDPNSPVRAIATVKGWLGSFGPCYQHEERRAFLRKMRQIAAETGFDEMPSIDELEDCWKEAHQRWVECQLSINGKRLVSASLKM